MICLGMSSILLGRVFADEMQIEVRDQYVSKSQLLLLTDTATFDWPADSHATRSKDASGWLVIVDLTQQGALIDHTTVIGPLWTAAGEQSSLNFEIGVAFGEADAAARKAMRPMFFDNHGNVVSQRITEKGDVVLEQLQWNPERFSWTKLRDGAFVGKVGRDYIEGRLVNRAAGLMVQQESDGVVRVYDRCSGVLKDDPWLVSAFTDLRARSDFHNVLTWLTDDGNHIVAAARDLHRDGQKMYREFTFAGEVYSRADFGLIYSRESQRPRVFKRRSFVGDRFTAPPHGAFVVAGELTLLEIGDNTLALRRPDGGVIHELQAKPPLQWGRSHASRTQYDPEAGRLVFFDSLHDPKNRDFSAGHYEVFTWEYRDGRAARLVLDLAELFELKDAVVQKRTK